MPPILRDMQDILLKLFKEHIEKAVRDFINIKIPKLIEEKEVDLNKQLQIITTKDNFLGCDIIDATPATIMLLVDFSGTKIPGVAGLKLSVARVGFTIERTVNLTEKSAPVLRIVDDPYFFTVEFEFKRGEDYMVAIGGGENKRMGTNFNQYRILLEWNVPSFRLRAFLAKSNQGGFLFDVDGEIPTPIPLGPTGMGLKGIGLAYGEKFAPAFDNDTNRSNAIEKMNAAKAEDYINWSAKHDLTKWIPVKEDLRLFGISATIVDMATAGDLVKVKRAGLTYLSFGPTIVWGGDLKIVNAIEAGSLAGAIDIRSKTIFLRGVESFHLVPAFPDIAVITGSVELSGSLTDHTKTWVAFGGYNMDGNSVTLFGLLRLSGGLRLVPLQGIAVRAAARVEGEGQVLGFGGGFKFWINIMGQLGWNPVEIGGTLDIGGEVWVKIIGRKIGLGVNGKLAVQLPAPKILEFTVNVHVDLPWPLPDFDFPLNIFKYRELIPGQAASPLVSTVSGPITYLQGPGGLVGKITLSDNKVWPDVTFVLPMQRIAGGEHVPGGTQTILNKVVHDGTINEGGVTVEHRFTELKIEKIDVSTGLPVLLPDIRACWLYTQNGAGSDRTSQLAIPCTDPLNWANSFEYAQPQTAEPDERLTFQTFGTGPSEIIDFVSGQPPQKRFGNAVFKSYVRFWVQTVPWAIGYRRAIISERLAIEFSAATSLDSLPVKLCVIRLLLPFNKKPTLFVQNGTLTNSTVVREIDDRYKEWSVVITRTKNQYALDLELSGGERTFQVLAVGYLIDTLNELQTPPLSVLTPGDYRLTIAGASDAYYKSKANSAPQTTWVPLVLDFTVIKPPLRPYLRYSTQGDERIFGLEFGGWNPNPKGIGFCHYQDHLGLMRAKVAYLSKIYPELWIAAADDVAPVKVSVTPCEEGTIAGSKPSLEWSVLAGNPAPVEEELLYEVPAIARMNNLKVYFEKPADPTDITTLLDQWSYTVSQYRNSVDHICPKTNGLSKAYGPFGTKEIQVMAAPVLPPGLDLELLPPVKLVNGWALPTSIMDKIVPSAKQSGLQFFQMLNWSGVFDADTGVPGDRILDRPGATDFNLLLDQGHSPLGFIIRTNEPVDWRRMDFVLACKNAGIFDEKFETSLVPSQDGCTCIVLLRAEGLEVRVPKGEFVLRGRFHLDAKGLTRLTTVNDHTKKTEEFIFTFVQPFGRHWKL